LIKRQTKAKFGGEKSIIENHQITNSAGRVQYPITKLNKLLQKEYNVMGELRHVLFGGIITNEMFQVNKLTQKLELTPNFLRRVQ
jgi:hypothetical protein